MARTRLVFAVLERRNFDSAAKDSKKVRETTCQMYLEGFHECSIWIANKPTYIGAIRRKTVEVRCVPVSSGSGSVSNHAKLKGYAEALASALAEPTR